MRELLQDFLTAQTQRRPDAVALVLDDKCMTYGELEAESSRLAGLLRAQGTRQGDRVCLLMPKSLAAISAILGVLKADGIYVPLDPSSPAARLRRMIDACDTRWILAGPGVEPLLEELWGDRSFAAAHAVGWMSPDAPSAAVTPSFTSDDLAAFPIEAPARSNGPDDPAHILFTSGSTGVPKGVVITHANVIHFVRWATGYFGTQPGDRISGHPPLHFDLSTLDLYGTLAAGAQLHLVPPSLALLPHKLAAFIRQHELTQWFSVPSVLNYMAKFDVVRESDFPSLRRLLWCGEVLPTPSLIHWMRRLPHVTFTNLYGPTEATIASSYYTVPRCPADEREPIPIGQPCAGEELLVLDETLQPVPGGEVGNLYIRGVGLSPGYWRDEEKTGAAFVPNPHAAGPKDRLYRTGDLARIGSDGLVYFLGRADSQIKARGYRIELGEVEAACRALNALHDCAIVAVDSDGFGGPMICCAYVPARPEVTPTGIRRELARLLPSYMLPARWALFEHLPQNPNGKIDRRRLREHFELNAAATA